MPLVPFFRQSPFRTIKFMPDAAEGGDGQTKILERRKIVRWVVFEVLFILASDIFGLTVMKSTSKTTHRTIFRRSKIFVWPSPPSAASGIKLEQAISRLFEVLFHVTLPKLSTHTLKKCPTTLPDRHRRTPPEAAAHAAASDGRRRRHANRLFRFPKIFVW